MTDIIPSAPLTLFHGLLLRLYCPELPTTAFTCSPVPCHFLSPSPRAQLLRAPLLQISALVTRMRIGGSSHRDFASMGPCKGDAPHELA